MNVHHRNTEAIHSVYVARTVTAKYKLFVLYLECLELLERLITEERAVNAAILAREMHVARYRIDLILQHFPQVGRIIEEYSHAVGLKQSKKIALPTTSSAPLVPMQIDVQYRKALSALGYYPGFVSFLKELSGTTNTSRKNLLRNVHLKRQSRKEDGAITVGKDLLLLSLKLT